MPGAEGRDDALNLFEAKRPDVLEALRNRAWFLWRRDRKPLSTNDIRHILADVGYRGDPRILGAVFRTGWTPVGWTTVQSERANKRPIRTFQPEATL